MLRRASIVLVPILLLAAVFQVTGRRAETLPAALTDREFWALTEQLSEPNGCFVSRSGSPDNLLSNEMQLSTVAAALAAQVTPSRRVSRRRAGAELHLHRGDPTADRVHHRHPARQPGRCPVYKALFEMSASRAEFVSRLFSRQACRRRRRTSSAAQLMNAYAARAPVTTPRSRQLKAIVDLLTKKHAVAAHG